MGDGSHIVFFLDPSLLVSMEWIPRSISYILYHIRSVSRCTTRTSARKGSWCWTSSTTTTGAWQWPWTSSSSSLSPCSTTPSSTATRSTRTSLIYTWPTSRCTRGRPWRGPGSTPRRPSSPTTTRSRKTRAGAGAGAGQATTTLSSLLCVLPTKGGPLCPSCPSPAVRYWSAAAAADRRRRLPMKRGSGCPVRRGKVWWRFFGDAPSPYRSLPLDGASPLPYFLSLTIVVAHVCN